MLSQQCYANKSVRLDESFFSFGIHLRNSIFVWIEYSEKCEPHQWLKPSETLSEDWGDSWSDEIAQTRWFSRHLRCDSNLRMTSTLSSKSPLKFRPSFKWFPIAHSIRAIPIEIRPSIGIPLCWIITAAATRWQQNCFQSLAHFIYDFEAGGSKQKVKHRKFQEKKNLIEVFIK